MRSLQPLRSKTRRAMRALNEPGMMGHAEYGGRVLISGAAGFVGRHLCAELVRGGHGVRALVRGAGPCGLGANVIEIPVGDLLAVGDWKPIMAGVDTVVHLAGRAHVMRESRSLAKQLYVRNNFEVTRSITQAAIESGVRRMIFVSTLKVFGEGPFGAPLRPTDDPVPSDDYGWSKLDAERWLRSLHDRGLLEVAIVRPPLVYGPGVRGNFRRLLDWVHSGVCLPLAHATNLRSLVSVWNLNDLLMRIIEAPRGGNGLWHVSDGEDCSTSCLIRELCSHMGKPVRLFSIRPGLVRFALTAVGRRREYGRLMDSMQLDISRTVEVLGWRPPLSRMTGLARTVAWYLDLIGRA